jgi:hypothetical protein
MAKASKKRKLARDRHLNQKRKAKIKRVLEKYGPEGYFQYFTWNSKKDKVPIEKSHNFEDMVKELTSLNVNCLEILLSDLKNNGYVGGWSGEYHERLIREVECALLEKVVLK